MGLLNGIPPVYTCTNIDVLLPLPVRGRSSNAQGRASQPETAFLPVHRHQFKAVSYPRNSYSVEVDLPGLSFDLAEPSLAFQVGIGRLPVCTEVVLAGRHCNREVRVASVGSHPAAVDADPRGDAAQKAGLPEIGIFNEDQFRLTQRGLCQ